MLVKTSKFSVFNQLNSNDNNLNSISSNKQNENENNIVIYKKITDFITYNEISNISIDSRYNIIYNHDKHNLTYGEIPYDSMKKIFNQCYKIFNDRLDKNEMILYDLGSGSGRSTLSAALLYPFKQCIGIEIIPELYEISIQISNNWLIHRNNDSSLIFLLDSFINKRDDFNWCQGDVILINSTCFDDQLMTDISLHGNVKIGSYIITLTKVFPSVLNQIKIIKEIRLEMSWGMADVFIQQVMS